MNLTIMLIICSGLVAIVYSLLVSRNILASDAGNKNMQEIATAIQEGAQAYLKRQYLTITVVGIVIAVLVSWLLGGLVAAGFVIGAAFSGAAGYIGMIISVRANVRTTEAARTSLAGGLSIAFRSGAVTGMLVAGLALISVTFYFYYLTSVRGYGETSRAMPASISDIITNIISNSCRITPITKGYNIKFTFSEKKIAASTIVATIVTT